jgi:hypothetical protein
MARRTVAQEIKLYGTLLGIGEAECERMGSGGSLDRRLRCMRHLRRRYREENEVPEPKRLSGLEQLDYWQSKVPGEPFVYFIQEGPHGPVKIGKANHPLKRMSDLQTGNPEQLHLRHVVPGDRLLEKQLHHRFREARIRGEWFGLAYLNIILLYADGLAAKQIDCFDQGRAVGEVVVGQHLMSPPQIVTMKEDLRSMVFAWGYYFEWDMTRFNEQVNTAMAEKYGFTPDEIEALVRALRFPLRAGPTRQWSRRGGKRLSGRA